MTAKQYLRKAYKLREQIRDKKERLAELREMSVSIGGSDYSKDRVQHSSSPGAAYTNKIAQIAELETELQHAIYAMELQYVEISRAIDEIKSVDCRLVLSNRYLHMMSWDEIAVRMNYSLRQIHRFHKAALEMFRVPETGENT